MAEGLLLCLCCVGRSSERGRKGTQVGRSYDLVICPKCQVPREDCYLNFIRVNTSSRALEAIVTLTRSTRSHASASWEERYGRERGGVLTARKMQRLPVAPIFPRGLQLHPLRDLPSEPTWRNCPELLQNNTLSAILQWIIISSSKLNAGIAMQVAKEMRQKVALIAQDHMAPLATASHSKPRRRCRKRGGRCGKPPATPVAPARRGTQETTLCNRNNCRERTRELCPGPAS